MLDQDTLDYFIGEAYITRPLRPMKSGKEATVVLCEAHPRTGRELIAIKEYRPLEERGFRADKGYMAADIRTMKNHRNKRAIEKKTDWGRQVQEGLWIHREWERLGELHEAGCAVPEPIAQGPRSIAMEYIGSIDGAAPQLHRIRMDRAQARRAWDQIVANVERMLAANVIHGDLSPYNILWWNDRAVIIDFPQAVDPRSARNATDLLERDLANVAKHFERMGLRVDAGSVAHGLWMGFMFADL